MELGDARAVALDAAKSRRRDTPMPGPRQPLPVVDRQLTFEVGDGLVEQEQIAALDPDRILEVEKRERRGGAATQQLDAEAAHNGRVAAQHAAAEQRPPERAA